MALYTFPFRAHLSSASVLYTHIGARPTGSLQLTQGLLSAWLWCRLLPGPQLCGRSITNACESSYYYSKDIHSASQVTVWDVFSPFSCILVTHMYYIPIERVFNMIINNPCRSVCPLEYSYFSDFFYSWCYLYKIHDDENCCRSMKRFSV